MALHQRFCREPECREIKQQIREVEQELHQSLDRRGQEHLLKLADLENELREETSLTSFIAGFRLGMGIAGELEPYCFEDEDERWATERAKMRCPQVKI